MYKMSRFYYIFGITPLSSDFSSGFLILYFFHVYITHNPEDLSDLTSNSNVYNTFQRYTKKISERMKKMNKTKKKKITAVIMSFIMLFTLTSCALDMDFIKYGWDGVVDGERIWGEERPTTEEKRDEEESTDESKDSEETEKDEESTEVVTDESGEVVTDKSGEAVTKKADKTSTSGNTGKTSSKASSGNSTTPGSGNSTQKTSTSSGGQATSADAVTVFNNAVNAGKPTSAKYNVTATDASFKSSKSALESVISSAFTKDDVVKQNSTNLTANHSAFTNISASDCSSVSIKDNGSSYTVVLNLKSVTLSATASPAKNGYMYFMNNADTTSVVQKANAKIIFMKNGTISLSNGIITATIDKASGKFTSCKLDLNEAYYDQIYIKDLLADAPSVVVSLIGDATLHGTFSYKLSVTYSF